jgi:histidine triad (HIT) family protein
MAASGSNCVFCAIVAGTESAHVVASTEDFLAFLDTRPVFAGHTLVIPRTHIATLADLPTTALAGYFGFVQEIAIAVEAGMEADGTFVAINNKISQSVPHLHTHVIPRRRKDGLRGFFWPRSRYESDEQAATTATAIASSYRVITGESGSPA